MEGTEASLWQPPGQGDDRTRAEEGRAGPSERALGGHCLFVAAPLKLAACPQVALGPVPLTRVELCMATKPSLEASRGGTRSLALCQYEWLSLESDPPPLHPRPIENHRISCWENHFSNQRKKRILLPGLLTGRADFQWSLRVVPFTRESQAAAASDGRTLPG